MGRARTEDNLGERAPIRLDARDRDAGRVELDLRAAAEYRNELAPRLGLRSRDPEVIELFERLRTWDELSKATRAATEATIAAWLRAVPLAWYRGEVVIDGFPLGIRPHAAMCARCGLGQRDGMATDGVRRRCIGDGRSGERRGEPGAVAGNAPGPGGASQEATQGARARRDRAARSSP